MHRRITKCTLQNTFVTVNRKLAETEGGIAVDPQLLRVSPMYASRHFLCGSRVLTVQHADMLQILQYL